jgi:hypothetical protein
MKTEGAVWPPSSQLGIINRKSLRRVQRRNNLVGELAVRLNSQGCGANQRRKRTDACDVIDVALQLMTGRGNRTSSEFSSVSPASSPPHPRH